MTQAANQPTDEKMPASPGLPLIIHTQYVKDISFENPSAPHSMRQGLPAPKMDLNINLDARNLDDLKLKDLYEVTIKISAKAMRDGEAVFIAEILYGVAVSFQDSVPQDQRHPLLMIEVPRLAFPFVRQIMSDLTQGGGFPALLLGPVDFYAMYMARFGKEDQPLKEAIN
ncbi:MAG: protein-export chaperone SecB [Micavibrio aeruginosavorus]|uniref:Protein-export chaperone SecB n=1 Tax=Micavibrio aeruginosavorus TaxID=349221 RepID=A0A2W5FN06_9BACT|nr:MAG: protein-export chaperone SecB [Micavibrio aeruginosavorus]